MNKKSLCIFQFYLYPLIYIFVLHIKETDLSYLIAQYWQQGIAVAIINQTLWIWCLVKNPKITHPSHKISRFYFRTVAMRGKVLNKYGMKKQKSPSSFSCIRRGWVKLAQWGTIPPAILGTQKKSKARDKCTSYTAMSKYFKWQSKNDLTWHVQWTQKVDETKKKLIHLAK